MANNPVDRIELLQGTLDMLILRTLQFGPAHGHQIAKHIQRTTEDILQVEHGSLYPALHRLQQKAWLRAEWKQSGPAGKPSSIPLRLPDAANLPSREIAGRACPELSN